MKVRIDISRASGTVWAPPSKSMAHRLLIAAGLAKGVSRISRISDCEDVRATVDCLVALGASVEADGRDLIVHGTGLEKSAPTSPLNCRESGSTLRFFIPIALISAKKITFTGAERLLSRPHGVYEDMCSDKGYEFVRSEGCITVKGPLSAADFYIRGDVSSQFISGLLFALPLLKEDSRIHITTKIESRSYIELTRLALNTFGVKTLWEDEQTLFIPGKQSYTPTSVTVEGDYSGSVFTESFNLFGGSVTQLGLSDDSIQGDRVYKQHFAALSRGFCEINIEDCPDLGPILFSVAAGMYGGVFTGTARLKLKESDRVAAMAEELAKFGATLELDENKVTVKPSTLHAPTEELFGHGDHRIVMALATLASVYGGDIAGAEAVRKSYPDYFKDIKALGIKARIYEA